MLVQEVNLDNVFSQLSRDSINIISIGEKASLDIDELIERSNENGIKIAGGIFPMIVHETKAYDDGLIIKQIDKGNRTILLQDIHNTEIVFPKLEKHEKSCIVFTDGLSTGTSYLLDRLYEHYWNKLSYVGGGCGSLSLEQAPCVFTNEGVFQNAAVIQLIDRDIDLGICHGWEKISGPFVANKTDGNRILELNWRPAFEVYKEVVEQYSELSFEGNSFFDISQAFPFGIYKEGHEDIVRDPIMVDEEGALVCVGQIGQNVSLNILKGDTENLFSSAAKATEDSIKNNNVKDVFVVDCISRMLYLKEDFQKELQAVHQKITDSNPNVELEGVLSLGEIASNHEGYLEFYNKTIVVSSTN
ncbi:FIST signal transduction protein [Reichenbachiella versicolor]|uniref:FIST signal transduction protein n=1 Tax=Reichenbachiella versicolor TaxID=1821036 RepID=UPI000D6DE49A|nr:FIST C-terminal domain-containing protein [Reichenbachiella versicolor]